MDSQEPAKLWEVCCLASAVSLIGFMAFFVLWSQSLWGSGNDLYLVLAFACLLPGTIWGLREGVKRIRIRREDKQILHFGKAVNASEYIKEE